MAQIGDLRPDDFVKGQLKDAVKEFMVYDGSNRLTDVYTANVNAPHGGSCLRTRYTYDGASGRIQKRLELLATWDASWEIP